MSDFLEAQKKADEWCGKYIKMRDMLRSTGFPDRGKCISCRKIVPADEYQWGHYYSRDYKALRYDEENTNGQCARCNTDTMNKALVHESYRHGLIRKYGEGVIDRLHEKKKQPAMRSAADLLEIAHHYHTKFFTLTHQ